MFFLFILTYRNFSNNKKTNVQLTEQNRVITFQNIEMEKKNIAIQLQKEIIEEKIGAIAPKTIKIILRWLKKRVTIF